MIVHSYTCVLGQLKRILLNILLRSSQFKKDVLFTAIKGGMKLLSFGLEGASVLYEDIVKACSHVLDSKNTEVSHVTCGHVTKGGCFNMEGRLGGSKQH